MTDPNRLANFAILYTALLLFLAVGAITTLGLEWYAGLTVPAWTPPQLLIAVIWCVLFLFAALSACRYWNRTPELAQRRLTLDLYMGNAFLVLLWNYLFFGTHALFPAAWAAAAVLIAAVLLVWRTSRVSGSAAWLLAPYVLWVTFATALTYVIATMNV
jgi:translocator protein